jgi:exonuclease SbcC
MRIERIRVNNLSGLEDVDLIFPAGPVLFFSKDKNCYRIISSLVLEIFYGQKTQLFLKEQNSKGSVEVWLAGKNTGFHVNRQFFRKGNEPELTSNLVIGDKTGRAVFIPEKMTPGEYLFLAGFNTFRQGGVVEWPERKGKINFFLRIQNIRQGGDERFSLAKVRASLAGAQRRLEEQKKSMMPVRAEYDSLRSEWEAAHRRQEEDRRLLIEIKNLQEKQKITEEKITLTQKNQQRLALLSQNPDYRELRRLQGEMNRLEERCRELAANITVLTHESQINWAVIESLREECLEWAFLQEKVEGLAAKVRQREQEIRDVQFFLQTSGYKELPKNGDQCLQQAEKERLMAQEELAELTVTKNIIKKIKVKYAEDIIHLQDFGPLTGVTVADRIRVRQREMYLVLWKNSNIGGFVDKVLQERFGRKSITERLSYPLSQFYQNYHVSNYQEFLLKLNQFQKQHKIVERLKIELELLQEKVKREDELNGIVDSRNQILKQAFEAVQTADFPAWLHGWEDYLQKKYLLTVLLDELKLDLEQQQIEENNMTVCAEQLREKLGKWETKATNKDEILAAVMRAAVQLRAKDEAEREAELFSQRFYNMLGDRDMEYLAGNLEPLADLERETHLSDEERLANLADWHHEQLENCRLQEEAEQRLRHNREFPELSVLEKKLETVKDRITASEDLLRAVDDAQSLLEISWQEWQTRYGKLLNEETERLYRKIFSLLQHEKLQHKKVERHQLHMERTYLACRMAIAQLALGNNTEVPLFFSVGKMNEEQGFWEEVIEYLSNLLFSRQVILETSDDKLLQIAAAAGWPVKMTSKEGRINRIYD